MRLDKIVNKRFSAALVVILFSFPLYLFLHGTYKNYKIITNQEVGTAWILDDSMADRGRYDYIFMVDGKSFAGTGRLDDHDMKSQNTRSPDKVPVYYSKDNPNISSLFIPASVFDGVLWMLAVFLIWLHFLVIIICPDGIQKKYQINTRLTAIILLFFFSWQLYGDIVNSYKNYKIKNNQTIGTASISGKEYWFGKSYTYNYNFTVDGKEYTGTNRIDKSDEKSPADVSPGSTVAVYYSKDNPSISLLHKPDGSLYLLSFIVAIGWIYFLIVIINPDKYVVLKKIRHNSILKIRLTATIPLLILSFFLLNYCSYLYQNYKLINNHSVGTATILSNDATGRYNYRFMAEGKEYTGRSLLDKTQSVIPAGRTVPVYYSKDNPEMSLLYMPESVINFLPLHTFLFLLWVVNLATIINPSLWRKFIKQRHGIEISDDIISDSTQIEESTGFQLLINGKYAVDASSAEKAFLEVINKIINKGYYIAVEELRIESLSLTFNPDNGEFTIKWPFTSSDSAGVKFKQGLEKVLNKNGFVTEKSVLINQGYKQSLIKKPFKIKIIVKHTTDEPNDATESIWNSAVETLENNKHGFNDQEWKNLSLNIKSSNVFILKWPVLCASSAVIKFKQDLVENLIKHGFIIKESTITLRKGIRLFRRLRKKLKRSETHSPSIIK